MGEWILPEVRKKLEEVKERSERRHKEHQESMVRNELNVETPNYLLLDGALWQEDLENAIMCNVDMRSLYRGQTAIDMWNISPYLFKVEPQSEFTKWVTKRIVSEPEQRRVTWVHSDADIDALRKHFRRFLRVMREGGGYLYFRFYDPMVLSYVLPNLTDEQLSQFFELINYVTIWDKSSNEKKSYFYGAHLKVDIKPLEQ